MSQDFKSAANAAALPISTERSEPAHDYGRLSGEGGAVSRGAASRAAAPPVVRLKPANTAAPQPIIGSSPAIKKVLGLIELYADEGDPVLICGETGTGKDVVAVNLHRQSRRSNSPYQVHNTGRIDRELVGSVFFGHVRGAFTGAIERQTGLFEQANGGSLHLDEIAELPIDLQANLLRVIEDGVVTPIGSASSFQVDVRLIAATNHDLLSAIEAGRFREDLYFRLSVLRIDLPPLRDRGEDVLELSHYFLAEQSRMRGRKISLSKAAETLLLRHDWPGNVRDLFHTLRRAALHAKGGVIVPEVIVFTPGRRARTQLDVNAGVDLITDYLVAAALKATNGNVSAAAKLTRINREKVGEIRARLDEEGSTADGLRNAVRDFLDF